MNNIDTNEIDKFSTMGHKWWDLDGPCQPLHALNPLRMRYIEKYCVLNNLNILDVGCGAGILTETIAKRQANVTGLDASSELIEIAKIHAEKNNLNINYITTSIESFQADQTNKFDIITCMELLEHVPNPQQLLMDCSRLIKPKGYLFLSTINRTWQSYLGAIIGAEYILKILPKRTHDYKQFIKPNELCSWMRLAKLEVLDIQGVYFSPLSRQVKFATDININYLMCCQKKDACNASVI